MKPTQKVVKLQHQGHSALRTAFAVQGGEFDIKKHSVRRVLLVAKEWTRMSESAGGD